MKIILDVMGSDKGPEELIAGAVAAQKLCGAEILYVGDAEIIRSISDKNRYAIPEANIFNTTKVISMDSDPFEIRSMKDSSMRVALDMLASDMGDAVVSCGNTGALHTGATLYVRRIKGVHRAAISAVLPMKTPLLLLDAGANLTVTPDHLLQFGIMGSVYMKNIFGISAPRVGLLNNGAEETKGPHLYSETYALLKKCPDINFVGNIEGKDIPFSKCDVLVCDGFTGNIALKTVEGMGKFMSFSLKGIFSSLLGKLSALLVFGKIKSFKKAMNAGTHGGAPLLGISKPVVKAHGSSDSYALCNAICKAAAFASTNVTEEIRSVLTCAVESEGGSPEKS